MGFTFNDLTRVETADRFKTADELAGQQQIIQQQETEGLGFTTTGIPITLGTPPINPVRDEGIPVLPGSLLGTTLAARELGTQIPLPGFTDVQEGATAFNSLGTIPELPGEGLAPPLHITARSLAEAPPVEAPPSVAPPPPGPQITATVQMPPPKTGLLNELQAQRDQVNLAADLIEGLPVDQESNQALDQLGKLASGELIVGQEAFDNIMQQSRAILLRNRSNAIEAARIQAGTQGQAFGGLANALVAGAIDATERAFGKALSGATKTFVDLNTRAGIDAINSLPRESREQGYFNLNQSAVFSAQVQDALEGGNFNNFVEATTRVNRLLGFEDPDPKVMTASFNAFQEAQDEVAPELQDFFGPVFSPLIAAGRASQDDVDKWIAKAQVWLFFNPNAGTEGEPILPKPDFMTDEEWDALIGSGQIGVPGSVPSIVAPTSTTTGTESGTTNVTFGGTAAERSRQLFERFSPFGG